MAAGTGLTPEQRQLLLQALIQGGNEGMTNPAAALQNLLQAPGGASAAQAIIGNLRNRLLPSSPSGAAGPSPAIQAARGLSGEEPTYAKTDPVGILGDKPNPAPKKPDDVADMAKRLAEKTPGPPAPPSRDAGGILAMGPSQGPDPGTVRVPNIPDVPSSVRRSVASGDAADRIRSWNSFLTRPVDQGGLGRTQAQATGEISSLLGESGGLNPNLSHDKGTGYGTAAWRDPSPGVGRKTNLINFTKAQGLDYRTVEGQQAFYRHEMLGDYKDANNAIASARTPAEALRAHVYQFERPADKPGQASARQQHFGAVQSAVGGQREVATAPDSMGRGGTTGQGAAPGLKPPPAAVQRAAPQPTGILAAPRPDLQAPTAPSIPDFQDSGGRQIKGLVLHHTASDKDGNVPQTADDVKAVYAQRHLTGAHLFMDRQGNVSQTLDFGTAGQHTRPGEGPGAGFGNRNTIGIEIAAKNDADITPEQRAGIRQLWPTLQARYPGITPLAHGEINPGHKEATEGATALGEIRSLGQNLPKPGEDVPLPPARPADLLARDDTTTDSPLTLNVTPSATETPAPDADLGPVTAADQGDLGGDVGGLLGGLGGMFGGGEGGDGGEDSGPSQLQEWEQEDAREPDKPILPDEDTKPGGILAGGGPIGEQDQSRVDLSRVFSPEGMGGTGLFGRDQGPDTTGFKAPVGLPTAGLSGTSPSPTAGILGAPETGIASITPPQLRSIAPTRVPLPPPRPAGIGGTGIELPPIRPPDLTTDALPPRRPAGLLGDQPGGQLGAIPSLPAVDPDRMLRDSPLLSPPALDPDRMQRDASPGILGPGMGGANPPWQDPPKPSGGLLGTPNTPGMGGADDAFSRLTKGMGSLSGLLGGATDQMGSSRKRLSGSTASPPLVPQTPLLTGGLLSNARQGIDLNRFFGLLSGRVG
jgi:hypothetical protein